MVSLGNGHPQTVIDSFWSCPKSVSIQEIERDLKTSCSIVMKWQSVSSIRLNVDFNRRCIGIDFMKLHQIIRPLAVSTTYEEVKLRQHILDRTFETRARNIQKLVARCELADRYWLPNRIAVVRLLSGEGSCWISAEENCLNASLLGYDVATRSIEWRIGCCGVYKVP